MIKIRYWSAAVLPVLLVGSGCSTMSPTDNGVVGGGLLGAGVGAIAGHALGNTGAGAALGAVTGAVAGGLVGNNVEKTQQANAAAQYQAQNQMAIGEVIQLVQSHVSDDVIITKIRTSGSIFQLTAADIQNLKANGASDNVVNEMMATATRYPRRMYSGAPYYGPPPYGYVVQPAPVVAVGYGYGYGRRW